MPPLQPGPGKLFVQPAERSKVRPSGIVTPTVAQDDAFHGTVIAMGAPAWVGETEGEAGLAYEPATRAPGAGRWSPVRPQAPCAVGDVVCYEVERVQIMSVGWGDEKLYVLEQRDVLGRLEPGVRS